jgi:hypothetical protein
MAEAGHARIIAARTAPVFELPQEGAMSSVEYKDVKVELGVMGKTSVRPGVTRDIAVRRAAVDAEPQAGQTIAQALQAEAEAGWEPNQPTDLLSLMLADRVQWRLTGGFPFAWKFTFDVAEIRFRRPVGTAAGGVPARFCEQCTSLGEQRTRFCSSCGRPLSVVDEGEARCGFCGKSRKDVRRLFAGLGVHICDECVNLHHEALSAGE